MMEVIGNLMFWILKIVGIIGYGFLIFDMYNNYKKFGKLMENNPLSCFTVNEVKCIKVKKEDFGNNDPLGIVFGNLVIISDIVDTFSSCVSDIIVYHEVGHVKHNDWFKIVMLDVIAIIFIIISDSIIMIFAINLIYLLVRYLLSLYMEIVTN